MVSWLYHNEYMNAARKKISSVLEKYGLHGKTEIDHEFDDSTQATINRVKNNISKEEKIREVELSRFKKRRRR